MKNISFIPFCFLLFLLPLNAITQGDTIRIPTRKGELEGTLLVPKSKKQVPVVLIISGSGPTDRNGNNAMMKNNSLKMVAEGLEKKGIASLRYDKRGLGGSKDAAIPMDELLFEDMVKDAEDWIRFLQKDDRFSKVIVAGHSEGSLIGMIAAKTTQASGFISIAGAGFPADTILRKQLTAQSAQLGEMAVPILLQLREKSEVDTVPPILMNLFAPIVQPYLHSWIGYDPRIEIASLDCPVLIIQGVTDIQVSVEDANNLKQAKPDADFQIIGGMNHVLKPAPADRDANLKTYGNPFLKLSGGLLTGINRFIKSRIN